MKKFIFIFWICLFFISVQGQALAYTLVRAAWSGLEPVIIADQKGFFKKEGIDIHQSTIFIIPIPYRLVKPTQ